MRKANAVKARAFDMERTQDKTNVKQESVKQEPKDAKHEGARDTRPDRPIADRDANPLQKRDEEQDKRVPFEKRDEEQDKQVQGGVPADKEVAEGTEAKGDDEDDAPDMAETESGNVVKTLPDDEKPASQGI